MEEQEDTGKNRKEAVLEKFSPDKVKAIRNLLEFQTRKGNPLYFTVRIDGNEVGERSFDLQFFDECMQLAGSGMELVIRLYNTANTSHIRSERRFDISNTTEYSAPPTPASAPNLNGLEMRSQWQQDIAKERKDWEREQDIKDLTKERDAAKSQLVEAETYIEKLETAVLNKADEGGTFKEMLEPILHILVSDKPDLSAKMNNALSGLTKGKDEPAGDGKTEESASFKKKGSIGELTEEEQTYIKAMREMQKSFTETEMLMIIHIINHLAENRKDIEPVAELLELDKENQKK